MDNKTLITALKSSRTELNLKLKFTENQQTLDCLNRGYLRYEFEGLILEGAFWNLSVACYPGCQSVFFRSEAAIVSGKAAIVILPREKKKPSGRGSYKPHFHAILKPNTSPNRFLRDRFAFVIDMSARVVTMRETAQNKLSQDLIVVGVFPSTQQHDLI